MPQAAETVDKRHVRERHFKKILPVKMTDVERLEYGDKAGALQAQIGEMEAARKAANDKAKQEIETKEGELQSILRTLRAKEISRDVNCVEVMDFAGKRVFYRRLDTFEEFEERTMERHELQMGIEAAKAAGDGEEDAGVDDGDGGGGEDGDGDSDEDAAADRKGRSRGKK